LNTSTPAPTTDEHPPGQDRSRRSRRGGQADPRSRGAPGGDLHQPADRVHVRDDWGGGQGSWRGGLGLGWGVRVGPAA